MITIIATTSLQGHAIEIKSLSTVTRPNTSDPGLITICVGRCLVFNILDLVLHGLSLAAERHDSTGGGQNGYHQDRRDAPLGCNQWFGHRESQEPRGCLGLASGISLVSCACFRSSADSLLQQCHSPPGSSWMNLSSTPWQFNAWTRTSNSNSSPDSRARRFFWTTSRTVPGKMMTSSKASSG